MPSPPLLRTAPDLSNSTGQGLSRFSAFPKGFHRGVWEGNKMPLRTDTGCATSLCFGRAGFSPQQGWGLQAGAALPNSPRHGDRKPQLNKIPAAAPENKQGG